MVQDMSWDIQDFIEQVTVHRDTQIFKIR